MNDNVQTATINEPYIKGMYAISLLQLAKRKRASRYLLPTIIQENPFVPIIVLFY